MDPDHVVKPLLWINKHTHSSTLSNTRGGAVSSRIYSHVARWSNRKVKLQRQTTFKLEWDPTAINRIAKSSRSFQGALEEREPIQLDPPLRRRPSNADNDSAVLGRFPDIEEVPVSNHANDMQHELLQATAGKAGAVVYSPRFPRHCAPPPPPEWSRLENMLVITRGYYEAIFAIPDWNRKIKPNDWALTESQPRIKIDSLNAFYGDMSDGFTFLSNSMFSSAFRSFDDAFGRLGILLREYHLQFLTYLCELMTRSHGDESEHVLTRFFRYLLEMSRILLPAKHPFIHLAGLLMASPRARPTISITILRSVLDLLWSRAGYLHSDTVGVLQTLSWTLLDNDEYDEARERFEQLVEQQEALHGPHSNTTCHAMRGLAETLLRQGYLDKAEYILQDIMNRSQWMVPRLQTTMQYRCMRLLSSVKQSRGQWFQAHDAINKAIEIATKAFGENSIQVILARREQEVLERKTQV